MAGQAQDVQSGPLRSLGGEGRSGLGAGSVGRVEGSGEAEAAVHRRPRGRRVMPSHVPSLQRQTSA